MMVYSSQYKTRFIHVSMPLCIYANMMTFIPKKAYGQDELKALLLYLNSSFIQLYIESRGITTGGGIIQLNLKHGQDMPIIDLAKLKHEELERLASLFDELEAEARKLGGADTYGNVKKLWDTIVEKIDIEITKILKLPKNLARTAKIMAKTMMERRLQRMEEATPEAIKGEETPKIRPPQKPEKPKEKTTPLDNFLNQQ